MQFLIDQGNYAMGALSHLISYVLTSSTLNGKNPLMGEGFILLTWGYGFMGGVYHRLLTR